MSQISTKEILRKKVLMLLRMGKNVDSFMGDMFTLGQGVEGSVAVIWHVR